MALKGQDLLPLLLRDLQLPVDHLSFGLFVSHRARRVGVVTAEKEEKLKNVTTATLQSDHVQNTNFVITISISIFREGYPSQAAKP